MKVLFVATVQSHICQFHKNLITELRRKGHQVEVAARDNLAEKNGLALDFADKVYDVPFVRSPFSFQNFNAYKALKKIIDANEYDVIHCNTPMGGVLTRLASIRQRKMGTRIVYMAHGFHFFKGAPQKNWLFYYPVEKFLSRFTDVLITINKEDYALAQEKMHAIQNEYVPGIGIDLARFQNCDVDKNEKRESVGVPADMTWVLSIGELLPDKNHDIAIRAISKVPNVFYTVAGNGKKEEELKNLCQELGVSDRVMFLGYRRDIPELTNSADIFLFPSRFEGLPVSLMEAMASGMAVVCSRVRGCTDLIDEPQGGILTGAYDVDAIADAIKCLIETDTQDKKDYNLKKIEGFSVQVVLKRMLEIYDKLETAIK